MIAGRAGPVRPGVVADERGDLGEGVFGGPERRVEQRALHQERVTGGQVAVGVAVVAVGGDDRQVTRVVQVRGAVRGVGVRGVVPTVRGACTAASAGTAAIGSSQAGLLSNPDSHGCTMQTSPSPATSRRSAR